MLYWPDKDPGDNLDYSLNWAARLSAGETITTSIWSAPAGITLSSGGNTSSMTTCWIGGGLAGQTYVVVNTITTNAGRTMNQSVTINVMPQ